MPLDVGSHGLGGRPFFQYCLRARFGLTAFQGPCGVDLLGGDACQGRISGRGLGDGAFLLCCRQGGFGVQAARGLLSGGFGPPLPLHAGGARMRGGLHEGAFGRSGLQCGVASLRFRGDAFGDAFGKFGIGLAALFSLYGQRVLRGGTLRSGIGCGRRGCSERAFGIRQRGFFHGLAARLFGGCLRGNEVQSALRRSFARGGVGRLVGVRLGHGRLEGDVF